jgi:superfamily II DNA or RNA helicase
MSLINNPEVTKSDLNKPSAPKPKPEISNQEISTYIGPKGYTIYKKYIDFEEQKKLKKELTVSPIIPKSPVQPPAFSIYKESLSKLYIPREFGIITYGEPDEIRIPKGDDITIPFSGTLRDYQIDIVNVFIKSATKVNKNGKCFGGGGLLEIPCGHGKTVMACKIISDLKKKTLIIVHADFLLNQWIERISQFLPTARVGRIQADIIDIENKDIVIGMLQSLSKKDYPENIFSSFGLTIVDECHHIGSKVFSQSLQKIITFYNLGLSATMTRKDGLTKVFKMFLGELIYQKKREADESVLVKAIEFITDDEEFNETACDYRGNPAYSTMISKLCTFNYRSEFIIKILKKELAEKSDQQIIILAHNKNLLTYLYDSISHNNIASVGYYVGGMKESDLKLSEKCTIIIATYAMAAEALDIKSLTTLLLATPRTDVIQAVGRILRVKHERPLVIDIIDSHTIFQKQWLKRRTFYMSNKYKILYTNSILYQENKWIDSTKEKKKKNSDLKGKCFIKIGDSAN